MIDKRKNKRSTESEHELDMAAGELLRRYRVVRGLSQTALGKKVGISFQQIQKYEKGMNRMSVSRLFAIASALEITPQDLLPLDRFEANAPKVGSNDGDLPSNEALRVAVFYDTIPDGEQKEGLRTLIGALGGSRRNAA